MNATGKSSRQISLRILNTLSKLTLIHPEIIRNSMVVFQREVFQRETVQKIFFLLNLSFQSDREEWKKTVKSITRADLKMSRSIHGHTYIGSIKNEVCILLLLKWITFRILKGLFCYITSYFLCFRFFSLQDSYVKITPFNINPTPLPILLPLEIYSWKVTKEWGIDEAKYSRVNEAKFAKGRFYKIWGDTVYFNRLNL